MDPRRSAGGGSGPPRACRSSGTYGVLLPPIAPYKPHVRSRDGGGGEARALQAVETGGLQAEAAAGRDEGAGIQEARAVAGSSAPGSDPAPRPAIDSGSGRDFPDTLFEVRVYCSSDVS
jgi:hypothetical protein